MEIKNSPPNTKKSPPYFCNNCNLTYINISEINNHKKLCCKNIISNEDNSMNCTLCDVKCSRKIDWNRHLLTKRHVSKANGISPLN